MIPVRYILMPVLGGIIGYITNDIAIKMLFRPRKAIYIGKWRLPFTPGLIPQQKDRIARSIGHIVSAQLLNAETLRASVLSEKILNTLRTKITEFLDSFAHNEDTLEAFAARYAGQERVETATNAVLANLERVIVRKLAESNIGATVIDRGMQLLKERLGTGVQAKLLNKEFMGQIETSIASAINELVNKLAPDIIHTEVHKISRELLEQRMCDLYQKYQSKLPLLTDQIVSLYERVLEEHLDKLVQAVDIDRIVYQKIAAFDAEELENLIFGIMKRELKAIVYLGALLGFLMGFLNILLL